MKRGKRKREAGMDPRGRGSEDAEELKRKRESR